MQWLESLKRISTISGAMGKVAMKTTAQKYFSYEVDHLQQAKQIRDLLAQLKGPVMKVAQFLATVPGTLPDEYRQEFKSLQNQAFSMGPNLVKRRMRMELGDNWQEKFDSFDFKAAAAASLGQVHKALYHGQELALKLQYPNMQEVIEADIAQLKIILGFYRTFNKSIDPQELQKEVNEQLRKELDYENEAQNMLHYQAIFQDNPYIHVPKLYPELSSKKLVTMQWFAGENIEKFKGNKKVAENLFYAWYLPFYKHGMIHGDPHPGNYLAQDNGNIYLLDFGCVRSFSKSFIQAVRNLYQALKTNNMELAYKSYQAWGFQNLDAKTLPIIHKWAQLLYEPLLDDNVRPIQKDPSAGWKIAHEIHQQLHEAGGITPPREFLLMDRAAVGIGSVLLSLEVELNWHQLYENILRTTVTANATSI